METKKKLLVSFSGGETSAYMAQWLWKNKQNEFEMIFVFANTGQENEETLEFVRRCELHYGFPVVWIEAKVFPQHGKGNQFTIVDFESADRSGRVFEDIIKKHGIPNPSMPHCSRELKLVPIKAYAKSLGWKKYYTAIGIRIDEADRMNINHLKLRLIYPLISIRPMNKPKINLFWSQQGFRLNLKGYQGNCKWCWKKGENKLYQILNENPLFFEFPKRMEEKYENYCPTSRIELMATRGEKPPFPIRFFRNNRSVQDLVNEASGFTKMITDDSQIFDYELDLFDLLDLDGESCDIYSECGRNEMNFNAKV